MKNLSSLKKGKHICDGIWISDLTKHDTFTISFFIFSPPLVSIEKTYMYETLESVFHHIFKHLEVHKKYSEAVSCFFNSLLRVWKSDKTVNMLYLTYNRSHDLQLHQHVLNNIIMMSFIHYTHKAILVLFHEMSTPLPVWLWFESSPFPLSPKPHTSGNSSLA